MPLAIGAVVVGVPLTFQIPDSGHLVPVFALCKMTASQRADKWLPEHNWVLHAGIEEAKRLMTEQPELKMQDIAERCGFASRQTFSRTFVRETGKTPSEWTA